MKEVDGFEKNEGFSDYWDSMIIDPVQASFWGITPDGGVHSFKHLAEAWEVADARPDIICFQAELA